MTTGALVAAVATAALVGTASMASAAPSATIDFTDPGYSVVPGSPGGQNGWVQARAGVDWTLVDNDTFPAAGLPAGGRSMAFSSTTVPSGGADMVAPRIDPAGEPPTGAGANTFDVSLTVASATGDIQPGLNVDFAIGGASRFGGIVNLRHTPDGLAIGSYWVPADATSTANAQWRSAVFTTVPANAPHVIRVVAVFLEGQPDLFSVFVDGILVSGSSGATTWENFDRLSGAGGTETADTVSFKRSSSAPTADGIGFQSNLPVAPGTAGLGLLFTGISYAVSMSAPPLPTVPPVLPPAPDPVPDVALDLEQSEVAPDGALVFEADGFLPFESVFATLFPATGARVADPRFGGWFQADASGRIAGTLVLPAGLSPGMLTAQFTGDASGFVAASTFVIVAPVVETPTEPAPAEPGPGDPGSIGSAGPAAEGAELAASGVDSVGWVVAGSMMLLAGAACVVWRRLYP